jgi:hypothetical protein
MPRNITVTFADGTSHVYQNAPDDLTPGDVAARAATDFGGRGIANIDGGRQAAPPAAAAAPAPSLADSVMGTIKSAAASVADAASGAVDSVKSGLASLAHSSEAGESPFATSTVAAPPAAPAPMSHADMIDAASAGGIPVGPPAPVTKPVIPHTEAVAIDQAAARRKAWDDIPQNPVQAGYNAAAGQAGKTLANLMTTAGEVTDTEGLRTLGRQYQAAADARINRAMQGNEDSDTVKTVAGVFSLAPLVAGPAGLGAMVTQAGVDGYADARQAGDSPGEAVSRGTAMALANYVGLRTQVPGLTGALTKAVSGAPAGQAIAALGHALTTNVGGMEATTVLGDLYDKMAPGGLKPNMSADDMLHDIAATAKSATLLTLAVPGVPLAAGHLFHAAHSLAHGDGNAAAAREIDGANPPPADATPTTAADTTAAAPSAPGPIGLDTLHDSIDEAARTVGLSPKATAALREAAAQRDPQDAATFVARAFHRMEANGLTTKPGAPGAFRDALAQRFAAQQPEQTAAAPAPKAGKPSVADHLAAIRPPEPAPADDAAAPEDVAPAPITPTAMAQANDIADAAHQAATSPFNDRPEPTDAQKAAGNYPMGHVQLHGLDITIENPQGSVRSGVDPDGKPWSNEMQAHYGFIRGTRANDGDHVDTFIGPNPESKTAYVIDQVDPATGKFDEPKTILGADSEAQARQLYAANYADGWNGLGAITALPMDAFKAWVRNGVKSKPLGDITQWSPTDERAQPDVAEPAGVPAGAGDGGGGPAVASGGDLGSNADVAGARGIGGDAAAPAAGARAPAAVDVGGGADASLTQLAKPEELGALGYSKSELARLERAGPSVMRATRAAIEILRRESEYSKEAGSDPNWWAERQAIHHELEDDLAAGRIILPSAGLRFEAPSPRKEHQSEKGKREYAARVAEAARDGIDWASSVENASDPRGYLIEALRREIADGNSRDEAGVHHQDVIDHLIREDETPAPRLLGKPVTDHSDAALQRIAKSAAASQRARDVASTELARRAAPPAEVKPAAQQADAALTKQSAAAPRAGIDPEALRAEVTRIQAGWKDAPPVHVVDDVNGLPNHIQDSLRSMGAEGKTRALLMPGRGSDPGDVYLIASRLKDVPMAQAALFHEVLGHYGIRKVLGSDATYFAEMYKLRQANPELAKEAEAWMQAHGRGAIADRMSRGLSQEAAMRVVRALSTEEALADRAGRGEPVRGLQKLMAKIQQWLRSVGLDSVADRLEKMTQAETAALLARARRAVEADATGGEAAGDMVPATSRPVREQGIPEDAKELGGGATVDDLKAQPDYRAAKAGDPDAAVRVVNALVRPEDIEAARSLGPHVVYAYPHAEEASGRNAIPAMLAHKYAAETGGEVDTDIVQTNRAFHTGANAMERMVARPDFSGQVDPGRKYVVVDDVTTMGGTLAELADHIRAGGGDVVGVVTLADASRAPTMVAPKRQTAEIESRYGQTVRDELHVDPRALTGAEAGYLIGFRNADELRNRVAAAAQAHAERVRQEGVRQGDAGGDAPLLSQHAGDEPGDVPDIHEPSKLAEVFAKVREAAATAADAARKLRDEAIRISAPMALGTDQTRALVKDFANADRLARWQWDKFDSVIAKNYDEAQRREMWEAADQEGVLRQQGKEPGPGEGLNRLTPDQRATVDALHNYGESLLQRAKAVGMFEGEGLPYWTPRMAVMIDGAGEYSRPKGGNVEGSGTQGRNIVTTASSLKGRKHLTAEDTEAAMKGKLGEGAQLVRDIRTMPLAMSRLERAIAGRELVNQIKAYGDKAGMKTVSTSEEPGFVTFDSPALKTWRVTSNEDGSKTFERVPLYVSKDFEGPLKAVMTEKPNEIYNALMALKGKSMGLIMYSPLIHNAVEWGRALPAMPGKVATCQIYFEGNRIKNDPVQMRQAISDGLVPIGRRGGIQDITGIMEDPSLTPGRSWTAKLIGGALGLASEKAGTAAKKAIDRAGDIWHNTLLWDRVGDLQAGLYGSIRAHEIAKGMDPAAAGKVAAHFANRFAGALPNEAMSVAARRTANMLMFSRTFTLGNMGLMKDMMTGLPRDVRAQIKVSAGELAAAAATSRARRIAIASFILDIGMMYIGNSLMQDAFKKMAGESMGDLAMGYVTRFQKLMKRAGDHPLDTLSNPFDAVNALSSTSENEPGKEDRIRVGTSADGTAIYMRLPTGKVGEDFKNWITKPLVTAKAKESQLVRPLQQVWNNDNGIGQRIYDPDAPGLGGVLTNAGRIAKLFATQMIPADAISGAWDWKKGTATDVDKLKTVGPFAGLTFSKGAPGGPAVGQMYAADRKFEGAKMDVMPQVKQAIKDGDDDKAIALLEGIKMPPSQIMTTLRHLQMPESRLSAGAFRRFSQRASDDDLQKMNELLDVERKREAEKAAATADED